MLHSSLISPNVLLSPVHGLLPLCMLCDLPSVVSSGNRLELAHFAYEFYFIFFWLGHFAYYLHINGRGRGLHIQTRPGGYDATFDLVSRPLID